MKAFRLLSEANLDVEEIANYIFDLNPVASHRFLDHLDEVFELLEDFPLIGRLRPDLVRMFGLIQSVITSFFTFIPKRA